MKKLTITMAVTVADDIDMNDHFESLRATIAQEFAVDESAVEIASVEESDIPE